MHNKLPLMAAHLSGTFFPPPVELGMVQWWKKSCKRAVVEDTGGVDVGDSVDDTGEVGG